MQPNPQVLQSHQLEVIIMRFRSIVFTYLIFCLFVAANAYSQKRKVAPKPQIRNFTVITEPHAEIWLNNVLRGTSDSEGKLLIRTKLSGAQNLRVRASGFKETTKPLLAAQKADVKILLAKTNDEAEISFQAAEKSTDLPEAITLYENAIKLRPKYAEAFIGLARVLSEIGNTSEAHDAIANARKIRPIFPEASAIEGRIFRSESDEEKMIESFKRAVREGKGFQPEAHAGIALYYKDKAEAAGSGGDFEEEIRLFGESAKSFRLSVDQLSGAPDAVIIYQLFGLIYEKMDKKKEAIAVYQEFLEFFPDSAEASAVRSFIVQLNREQ